MRRTTEDGRHPAVSAYRTENVNTVVGLPEPGVTRPELSVVWWDAPLQLAAAAGGTATTRAVAASAIAKVRLTPRVANRCTRGSRFKIGIGLSWSPGGP